jgi:hypothetical protein
MTLALIANQKRFVASGIFGAPSMNFGTSWQTLPEEQCAGVNALPSDSPIRAVPI